MEQDYVNSLKLFYASILSHEIGLDGRYLFALTKLGQLAAFPLRAHLKTNYDLNDADDAVVQSLVGSNTNRLKPSTILQVPTPCSSLSLDQRNPSTSVIVGGRGCLRGYSLDEIDDLKFRCDWTLALPTETADVNALEHAGTNSDHLLAGCSNNNIYHLDCTTNQVVGKLVGHEDYIHVLKHRQNLLYSGGEDGRVIVWDLRSHQAVGGFEPNKVASLERKAYSKWIGALDVNPSGDWLVCGGGPRLSMWHLRSQTCSKSFESNSIVNVVRFLKNDDGTNFITAGTDHRLDFWSVAKEVPHLTLDTQIANVYSIGEHNFEQLDYNAISIAGDTFKIDICKNQRYLDCELYLN